MNLVPVDTDPFAAPSLVPVDHDPFASPQADDPGFVANAARALRMGLPFGNQFVAAEKTVLPQSLGGSQGFDYGKNLQDVNAADARLQQEHPVIADLGQGTGAALGALAVPAAALGEGAQGLGLVGRATRGGLTGAGLGAVQGAGAPGSDIRNIPQTEEGAVGGLYAGGALGAGFPALGAGVGGGVSALADALRGGPGKADLAALGAAKNAAYQNVKDLGAAYSPQSFKYLTDKIASDAAEADIDPDLNPKATKIIANLQNRSAEAVKSGTPVTLTDLDKARQFVNDNLSGLPEPKQARFGSLIKDNIDDFVNTAFPGDMVPMPAKADGAPTPGVQASIRAMTPQEIAAGPTPADVSGAAVSGAVGSRDNAPAGPVPTPPTVWASGGSGSPAEWKAAGKARARVAAADVDLLHDPLRPQVPAGPEPTPMLDFLRNAGGLKDEGGDLASMGFADLKPGFVDRGAKKIIDKENGLPMDEARRMAVEQGYMEPHETVPDFINKLGEHPTYSIHDEEAVAARAARDAYDRGPQEEETTQPLSPQRAPEDFAGVGEAPPSASRPAIVPSAAAAAPTAPVASAQEAAEAIQNARDLAQRQFKANALLDALNKAKINAAKSGIGGNTENAARQRLAAILDQEPWSADEKSQLNKMVLGTPVTNTLREASRLSPFQNTLMKVAEGTSFFGAPTTTTLAAALGSGAHLAGNIARRSNQNELMRTILAGGKAPVKATPRQAPVSRAAMAAALAANADLQAQRNQATPQ